MHLNRLPKRRRMCKKILKYLTSIVNIVVNNIQLILKQEINLLINLNLLEATEVTNSNLLVLKANQQSNKIPITFNQVGMWLLFKTLP